MVSAMVLRGGVAACLCLSLAAGSQAAGLKTRLDLPRIALGEPLTLTLAGTGLEGIDLAPLAGDFHLHGSTLNRGDDGETLALTLYPLREGHLAIPPLQAGPARSRAMSVTVTAGSEATPPVRFRIETDPATPLARQPARLTLEACDDGGLDWKRPVLPTREGLFLRPLGEQQMEMERDGVRCTAHRWHWAATPTAEGYIALAMPMLEAGKFGRQLRFPPPAGGLEVSPVPAWLPAEAAVGRPAIKPDPLPATWPVDRPLAWRFEVTGGYSPTALKALLALQLAGQPRLNVYPPSVETLAPEDANSPLTRLAVTLYALPDTSGPFALPPLALPWFDPDSGRLQSLILPGHSLDIHNPLYARLLRAGLGVSGLLLLAVAGRTLRRVLAWRRARRRGLALIGRAPDLPSLLAAVRAFTLKPGLPPAPTLGQWRTSRAMACDGLDELIAALEVAGYGNKPRDPPELREQALKVLGGARPV